MKSRRISRIFALQALFALEFHKDKSMESVKLLDELLPELKNDAYALELISKVLAEYSFLNKQISEKALKWSLHRINYVDRNILRLGFAELKLNIDKAIVINEYVEIAKQFSTSESSSFINGILN